MENRMRLYGEKVYGVQVSDYGLEHGYLDYHALSEIIGDSILNNNILQYTGYENWELDSGEEEDNEDNYHEVYQYYIITDFGARFLREHTD